jgi:transcriptional regulator with XRE-family HTH domain
MDLREYLFKNNLTIVRLAKILNANRQYIHAWLRGDISPSQDLLNKIKTLTNGQISTFEQLVDRRLYGKTKDSSGNRSKKKRPKED